MGRTLVCEVCACQARCAYCTVQCVVRTPHVPRMDAEWFKDRQRRAGVTSFDLGEALGRDRTIVARIYAGRQRMTFEQARVFSRLLDEPLAEVLKRAGIAGEHEARQAADGFSDGDAVPWSPHGNAGRDNALAISLGQRPGVDVWRVRGSSMTLAGYLPGDRLLVDARAPERVRPGDVVIAQVYDWQTGSARTLLRQFQRPALVAHSSDPVEWVAHIVDDINVSIKGVITAQWRTRDE